MTLDYIVPILTKRSRCDQDISKYPQKASISAEMSEDLTLHLRKMMGSPCNAIDQGRLLFIGQRAINVLIQRTRRITRS